MYFKENIHIQPYSNLNIKVINRIREKYAKKNETVFLTMIILCF